MEYYELAELIEHHWSELASDPEQYPYSRGRTLHFAAFATGRFKVIVTITTGRYGGLSKAEIVVYDPRPEIMADRIRIVADIPGVALSHVYWPLVFASLRGLGSRTNEAVQDSLRQLLANPPAELTVAQAISNLAVHSLGSIATLSGGLPTLGRRR